MVYKDLWPLKLYFQHERAGFGLNQCVSAGLQLSEAVVWGGEGGVSSVRRVMEQQQSPSCCCVLVLHHTMGSWEGPWCLHQERGSAWIRIHPKITWLSTIIMFSTVFARCCYSTCSGGGGRTTPSLYYMWKRIKLWGSVVQDTPDHW